MKHNKVREISIIALAFLLITNSSSGFAATKPTPLPGVMAVDLYMNLEKQGWKCSRPKQAKDLMDPTKLDKNKTTFDCFNKDKSAYVIAWGTTSSNLTWITATATEIASYGWLGFIATLPISGVDQAAAQKWVTSTVKIAKTNKPIIKLFGDIRFQITGGKSVGRILEISHKSTKSA